MPERQRAKTANGGIRESTFAWIHTFACSLNGSLSHSPHNRPNVMAEIKRSTLFGKLNSLAYKAVEGATVFCKLRGNPYVELVHWIAQILQTPDSDLQRLVKHFELESSRLAKDITDALDRLPRGASSISDLSSQLDDA